MKYTSKNFHLHYISQYKLFVKTDFLVDTLLVLNDHHEILALYSYPSNEPHTEAVKLLGLPFKHVLVSIPLHSLVFIPLEVFDEERQAVYQDFLLDEHTQRSFRHTMPTLGITAVYQLDLLLYNRWKAIFAHADFVADFQLLLGQVQSYIPLQGEVLGVHFKDTQVELYVFKNGIFQLYNLFEVGTVADLHYFVLNTMQTLTLGQHPQKILVSGINEDSAYVKALERFTENIEFIKAKGSWYTDDVEVEKSVFALNLMIDFPLCAS